MYSALPANSALPTDGTDPEGSQLAVVDFFDPAVQCPTSVGRCTPQTPEDRFGTARVTVGYDVGALIEHPLEPWKVSMLAGWSRAVVARLAGGLQRTFSPNLLPRRMCRPTHTAGHTFPPSTILKIGAAIAPLHRAVSRAGYTHIRRPGVSYGYVAWRCSAEPVRRGFQKRTGESRRRAGYSTTMSLPDTDTVPRSVDARPMDRPDGGQLGGRGVPDQIGAAVRLENHERGPARGRRRAGPPLGWGSSRHRR